MEKTARGPFLSLTQAPYRLWVKVGYHVTLLLRGQALFAQRGGRTDGELGFFPAGDGVSRVSRRSTLTFRCDPPSTTGLC